MPEWNDLLKNYIVRHSNTIQKVTRPLKDHLGIAYFGYHKIDHKGRRTPIMNLPEWAEIFVNEKVYNYPSLMVDFRLCKSGSYFFNYFFTKEYIDKIETLSNKLFDIHQNIILINNTETYSEFFGFFGEPHSKKFQNVYMHRLPLLKRFTGYFKEELREVLQEMEENTPFQINMHPLGNESKLDESAYLKFLSSIGLDEYARMKNLFSRREKECLILLLKGFSAKETASILHLSQRTIESYFETIKRKCQCWSKNNVFTIAKELDELSLLD